MTLGRQVTFWLITFLVILALLWLLSEVLLPFVAGIALAYVQAPLADRLERLGLNRTLAALLIVSVVVLALLAVALLVVPILVQQAWPWPPIFRATSRACASCSPIRITPG